MIADWLANIEKTYSVNPIIFAVLYFGTFIPCWYFVFKIISTIGKKDFNKLILYSSIELFLLVLPYLYVLIFGRNFPYWVYIILVLLVALSVVSGFKTITKKLKKENKSQVLWDFYSYFYNVSISSSNIHKEMYSNIIKLLNPKKGNHILDAGCGSGQFEDQIIDSRYSGVKINAIDFSGNMLRHAKKNSQIVFQQLDLNNPLPFKDQYFDSVIAISVIFTLPRLEYSLKELKRVLKKGGELIIVEPKPDFNMSELTKAQIKALANVPLYRKILFYLNLIIKLPIFFVLFVINTIMNRWAKVGYYHYLSEEEILKIFKKLNIRVVKTTSILAQQNNLIIAVK